MPPVLWRCWLGVRKSILSVKIEQWCWCGYLSEARCRLFAPIGLVQLMLLHPKTPPSLASFKPRTLQIHTFNGPFSGTTQVSGYQKGKINLDFTILLKQETVSGSGISWAICKSAPRSRQITMPAPHHSSFLQAGCHSCHPTVSKHWRQHGCRCVKLVF